VAESSDITFVDNYCDAHASQAVLVDDVRNVVIRGNQIDSTDFESSAGVFKAFAFANNSTNLGLSSDITFSNNYCDAHASQAVWMDDVRNVTLKNNDVQRVVQKAFALTNNSVGATVSGNRIAPRIENEISMDDTSQIDYHGPTPQGSP
jgi:polygalacturonase